jgi:hypothetical protein
MANKKLFWGISALALVFGLVLAGCGDTDGDDNSGGLNGTWVSDSETSQEITLNNGNFEVSRGGSAIMKGTYTASGGKLTSKPTLIHGSFFEQASQMGLESKWYTKDELKSAMADRITDELFESMFAEKFAETTSDYSVSDSTLTMTSKGETTTYTRK